VDLGRQIPRENSRRRKWKFGKSCEYYLIDRTAFHIWSFERTGFLSAGKLSTASIRAYEHTSIFGHCRVCHSVLPKHAYKIVVDDIESHPFHREIEDDWILVHQTTDPKRPSLKTSFFPKKGKGERGQGEGSEQFVGF
jgi:hypothetical protein